MVTWRNIKRDLIPSSRCQADESEGDQAGAIVQVVVPSSEQTSEKPKVAEEISIVVTKSSDVEGDKIDEPNVKVIFPAKDSTEQESSSEQKKDGEENFSGTDSTKSKESVNSEEAAPFNTILDFLSSLLTKNYPEALRLSKTILKYEPNNKTVAEFLNVLEEVVAGGLLEDSSSSSSSSSTSSESDSSSSSSSSSSESETSGSESECSDSENEWEDKVMCLMVQRDRHRDRCRLPSAQTTTTTTTSTTSSSSRSTLKSPKVQCHCYAALRRKILASAAAAEPSAEFIRRSVLASAILTPDSSDLIRQSLTSSGTSSSDSSDLVRHSILASAMSGSACTNRSFVSLPSSTLTPLPSDVNRSLLSSASSMDTPSIYYDDNKFGKQVVSGQLISECASLPSSSSGETTDDGYSS